MVFAIGMMMLFSSDQVTTADEKKKHQVMSFSTSKDVNVFVNKQGKDETKIDVIINGEKHSFDLPELKDGETKTITTDDGTEIKVIAASGNQMIWVDGEEVNLPKLEMLSEGEGLSTIISRVHMLNDHEDDSITINASGLSEDASSAIVDAVKGVLTSYGIDRKVRLTERKFDFKFIGDGEGVHKLHHGENVEIKMDVDVDGKVHKKIMVIEKQEDKN